MAYDSFRGKLVLFGGYSYGSYLGDTWEWDGSAWTQVATTGPLPRSSHAMAYDSQRHRVVLFGGVEATAIQFGDTWEWDGTSWIQMLASGPSARVEHAMVYDSQRHRVVLFGGYAYNAGYTYFGDTWEWDGTSWVQQLASSPPARFQHAMAFDIGRARTVLFGGRGSTFLYGDTWEWDGTSWIQLGGGGPSYPGINHAMAFDGSNVVLVGGSYSYGETWVWNGTSWSFAIAGTPFQRYGHAMAYDDLHGRALLFGGHVSGIGAAADTWEWTGLDARAGTYGAGCGSPSLDFQPNPAARPLVGQVARATIVNPPTSVAAVMIGLSNQYSGAFPLPLTLAGLGMPGCDLWMSGEFFGLGASPLPPSSLEFSLLIPNVSVALGFRCYLQSCAFAPGQNPLSIIVSNGIEWIVGTY